MEMNANDNNEMTDDKDNNQIPIVEAVPNIQKNK